MNNPVEPDELDTYLGPDNSQRNEVNINETFFNYSLFSGRTSDHDHSRALMNNLPAQTIGKFK